MARGSRRRNRPVVPEALAALDRFKYEIANELNLPSNVINTGYWGNLPSAQCGAVGGQMVRRMIEAAQRSLIEEYNGRSQGRLPGRPHSAKRHPALRSDRLRAGRQAISNPSSLYKP